MSAHFFQRNILCISDFLAHELVALVQHAIKIKRSPQTMALKGKLIACCFFEASTRTRLSFEAAVLKSGGHVIGFDDTQNISLEKKGESLADTCHVVSQYVDALIIRHPQPGAAQLASTVCEVPVINAGDGGNQHPTQTFLDLMSIYETQQRLTDLKVVFVGDLKYGRTVHSLVQALSLFACELVFIAPEHLSLPETIKQLLDQRECVYHCHTQLTQTFIHSADILYMTRFQEERFTTAERHFTTENFQITRAMLTKVKPNLKIMHPLPRRAELQPCVDQTTYAYYFEQAKNGLYARQALLDLVLNRLPTS